MVFLITNSYHHEIPYFGTERYDAIFFFLGLISCAGVITFLYSIKNEVRMWYLGLPLLVAIVIVTLSSFISDVSRIFRISFGWQCNVVQFT
ncbi:hypothetical protein ASZ90_016887 [hydrocarbon metagenome]|uniref:Uncharacterized protein n=1 Tax=hydrocarbon metagenome TaxID=938273 RepID=A0A0W8EB36_9ZZZZ